MFLQANFEVESVTNAQRAGICGNGMCENGERCDSSSKSVTLPGNTTCCLMDCPFVSSTCPIPLSGAGANKSCAGNGICLDASGQCSCFVGATLPFLQVNVLLVRLNTISWSAVVSVCDPYTQLVSPRTWYSLPIGQEHSITLVFVPVPIFLFNVHGCNWRINHEFGGDRVQGRWLWAVCAGLEAPEQQQWQWKLCQSGKCWTVCINGLDNNNESSTLSKRWVWQQFIPGWFCNCCCDGICHHDLLACLLLFPQPVESSASSHAPQFWFTKPLSESWRFISDHSCKNPITLVNKDRNIGVTSIMYSIEFVEPFELCMWDLFRWWFFMLGVQDLIFQLEAKDYK